MSAKNSRKEPKVLGKPATRPELKPAESSSTEAAKAEAAAWWAKYRRVDAEITAALERRRAARARNARARARTFGDLCEMTEGRAKFARDRGISLAEADLRRKTGVTVLCIRRPSSDPKAPRKMIMPQASDVIEPGDRLIVFGETRKLDELSS